MNSFFVPQLGSQIYTMAGDDHPSQPAGGQARRVSRVFRRISAATGFPTCGSRSRRCPPAISTAGSRKARGSGSALDDPGYAELAKPSQRRAADDLSLGRPEAVRAHRRPDGAGPRKGARRRGLVSAGADRREAEMLGRLSWAAIPFNEPHPAVSGGGGRHRRAGRARRSSPRKGGGPICGASG